MAMGSRTPLSACSAATAAASSSGVVNGVGTPSRGSVRGTGPGVSSVVLVTGIASGGGCPSARSVIAFSTVITVRRYAALARIRPRASPVQRIV